MPDQAELLSAMERHLRNQVPPPDNCLPVEFHLVSVCDETEVVRNVMYALNTGHPQFIEQAPPNDRTVSICGSAPSLLKTYKDLTGDVWACNDAGWKLAELGVVPKYWMMWDPQAPVSDGSPYWCLKNLHKDTTFLVASICNPAIFDALKDYNVLVWHPYLGADIPMEDWLRGAESPCKQLVGFTLDIPQRPGTQHGTSAAVTRSAQFAPLMGYRNLHLHGVDSSTEDGKLHFTILETDKIAGKRLHYYPMWCGVDDIPASRRMFVTTGQMHRQTEEFIPLVNALNKAGVKVTVHGWGAIPWLAMLKGWHVNSV